MSNEQEPDEQNRFARREISSQSISMEESSSEDFILDKSAVSVVENVNTLYEWLNHTDLLLANSDCDGLEVDKYDIASLLLRKSTILTTLGNYENAKHFALEAINIQESSLGYFRLAWALYCLKEYHNSLQALMQAKNMDASNDTIQAAIAVVLARIRSRKDRPKVEESDS